MTCTQLHFPSRDTICAEYDDDPLGPWCRLCGHAEACHTPPQEIGSVV